MTGSPGPKMFEPESTPRSPASERTGSLAAATLGPAPSERTGGLDGRPWQMGGAPWSAWRVRTLLPGAVVHDGTSLATCSMPLANQVRLP